MALIRPLLLPFIALSGVGLALSLIVHVCALLGIASPLGELAWLLHAGILVVWLPAVLVIQPLTREFKQKDLWRAALRGCPRWMRVMTYGFFGYALINFVVFLLMTSGRGGAYRDASGHLSRFSGHWMAFYSAALAIFYSARHAEEHDRLRRCLAGHPVSPLAKYCEECGQPVHEATRPL